MFNNKKGFTLIELLVVVAIIGVLATVVLSSLGQAREKAKEARALSDMRQIRTAFQMYLLDTNARGINLPPTATHGTTSFHDPDCVGNFNVTVAGNDFPNATLLSTFAPEIDPYFDTSILNPWGYEYEIDAVYNCISNQSARGCEGKRLMYAIVANKTNEAVNIYSPGDVVYSICDHAN